LPLGINLVLLARQIYKSKQLRRALQNPQSGTASLFTRTSAAGATSDPHAKLAADEGEAANDRYSGDERGGDLAADMAADAMIY
jgi:hypothetical protein